MSSSTGCRSATTCRSLSSPGPASWKAGGHALETAYALAEMARDLDVGLIYKTSFDKANRTSLGRARGVGLDEALPILAEMREQVGVPVITDVHDARPVRAGGRGGGRPADPGVPLPPDRPAGRRRRRPAAPSTSRRGSSWRPGTWPTSSTRSRGAGNDRVMVCERGASFGYNTLVIDMRALPILARTGCPVVFDATHSVQQPGGKGTASGGQREFAPVLARAAVAVGVAAVFMETHPDPDNAPSDGPNMIPMKQLPGVLGMLLELDRFAKAHPVEV